MAIRVKGTIGGTEIDLTIEGIDASSLTGLAKIVTANQDVGNEPVSDGDNTPTNQARRTSNPADEPIPRANPIQNRKAYELALNQVQSEQRVLSSDLINYLSNLGMDDLAIKRALLMLRESGEVIVEHSDDGLQRVYRCKK